MPTDPQLHRSLSSQECYRLLASVAMGRVAFTMQALPVIRPVNHLVHDDDIIIRTHADAALMSAVGQVVAYEADVIDAVSHVGWSVIVTGKATLVRDPAELERFRRDLDPWFGLDMHHVIRISPGLVTGYELLRGAA